MMCEQYVNVKADLHVAIAAAVTGFKVLKMHWGKKRVYCLYGVVIGTKQWIKLCDIRIYTNPDWKLI